MAILPMKVRIFTTGGSIDKTYSTKVSDFVVGEAQVGRILAAANVNVAYEIEEICRKDSLALSEDDRALILARVATSAEQHILITHGTDTMIHTAQKLASVTDKTIVLTGAMQPAAFMNSDAALNLGVALAALALCAPGVYIAMSGRVFAWDTTRKNFSTDQFEAITP